MCILYLKHMIWLASYPVLHSDLWLVAIPYWIVQFSILTEGIANHIWTSEGNLPESKWGIISYWQRSSRHLYMTCHQRIYSETLIKREYKDTIIWDPCLRIYLWLKISLDTLGAFDFSCSDCDNIRRHF